MHDMKSPILVAHQPEFFPWLGFISKARMGDVYYILDTVQFMKEHWHSRNKIRKKDGWIWISTPVLQSKSKLLMWPEARIDNSKNWKRKQLNSIRMCYSRAKYFEEIFTELEEIYSKDYEYLIDFSEEIIRYAFKKFDINIPVYRTSKLIENGKDISGKKSDLIIKMCKSANAKTFVFGQDGKTYIEKDKFDNENINYVFQKFSHPEYKQRYEGFESHMSFIDLLFNYGPKSKEMLGEIEYDKE
jgi:hypothetical protein|tara:strand:- start:271 stop:1002 length:732 start_codon:yes stop_codon:yes gene_type:complete